MDVKELRIGNWITEPNNEDKKPFQVWGLYHEEGNNKINNLPVFYFKPVPLTEDVLRKVGRLCNKKELYYLDEFNDACESYNVQVFDKSTILNLSDEAEDCECVEIKYVHELQNLLYYHTKRELEIKF